MRKGKKETEWGRPDKCSTTKVLPTTYSKLVWLFKGKQTFGM